MFQVVKLTEAGLSRVLNGFVGMTFIVNRFSDSAIDGPGKVAHVRDYRYRQSPTLEYQIWSLAMRDYELVEE